MTDPTIICVLGMHRSGTSLISRVLNLLGVALGPDEHLMSPGPENPMGYWESQPLTDINEEILATFGGTWSNPPDLPPDWEAAPALARIRRDARRVIEEDFGRARLWGWKDPRTCLTLPFWQKLLPPMRFVLCVRNPIDVAESLASRSSEPIPQSKGLDLWFSYTSASLVHSTGHPRMILAYEDLMREPLQEVGRLEDFVGSTLTQQEQSVRSAIRVSVDEDLWHHRASTADVAEDNSLALPLKSLYLMLRLAARNQSRGESDFMAAFSRACDQELGRTESLSRATEKLQAREERVRRRNNELKAQLRQSNNRLENERGDRGRLQAQLRHRNTKLELARSDLERVRADLAKRESVVAQLRKALRQERKQGKDLAVQLDQRDVDLETVGSELERRAEEVGSARLELDRLQEEVSRLSVIVDTESHKLQKEVREGEQLRAQLSDRRAELDRLRSASIETAELKREVAELPKFLNARPHPAIPGQSRGVSGAMPQSTETSAADPASETPPTGASPFQPGGIVLVVSGGAEKALAVHPATGWHFPRTRDGSWVGDDPPNDGIELIAHLEVLRREGATHLVIPASSAGWLADHTALRQHLEGRFGRLEHGSLDAVVYALGRSPSTGVKRSPRSTLAGLIADLRAIRGRDPAILDWDTGLELSKGFRDVAVFSPPAPGQQLPYTDASVDVVVLRDGVPARLAEARRVASICVAIVATTRAPHDREPPDLPARLEWLGDHRSKLASNVSVLVPARLSDPVRTARMVAETLPSNFAGELIVITPSPPNELARTIPDLDVQVHFQSETEASALGGLMNRASLDSRSEILVLLGDVVPLPGWLPALIGTFTQYQRAGLVGAKLLDANGALREAGGDVSSDGLRRRAGWGVRRPDSPPYNHVRPIDFCSASILATPIWALRAVGGLAETYRNPDLVIVDYCRRLKERGLEILFQPRSVGVRPWGVDTTETVMADAADEAEFVRRWAEREPDPAGASSRSASTRGRGN